RGQPRCSTQGAVLFLISVISPHGPQHCCFTLFLRRINLTLITSYSMTDPLCPLQGVILKTRRGRYICMNPKDQWLKSIIHPSIHLLPLSRFRDVP
uniref:Chemokine interleukin-8-like domain-containing protein n=1 Tax=Gouania willdenowi TaxID=441366 RepID=A0A8C5G5Z4_GOUWI